MSSEMHPQLEKLRTALDRFPLEGQLPADTATFAALAPQLTKVEQEQILAHRVPNLGGVCFDGPGAYVAGAVNRYLLTDGPTRMIQHLEVLRPEASFQHAVRRQAIRAGRPAATTSISRAMDYATKEWGAQLRVDRSAGVLWCALGEQELFVWLASPVLEFNSVGACTTKEDRLDALIDGALLDIGVGTPERSEMEDALLLPQWIGFCDDCGAGTGPTDQSCRFCGREVGQFNRGGYGVPPFPIPRRFVEMLGERHKFPIDPERARRAYYRGFTQAGPFTPRDPNFADDTRGFRMIKTGTGKGDESSETGATELLPTP